MGNAGNGCPHKVSISSMRNSFLGQGSRLGFISIGGANVCDTRGRRLDLDQAGPLRRGQHRRRRGQRCAAARRGSCVCSSVLLIIIFVFLFGDQLAAGRDKVIARGEQRSWRGHLDLCFRRWNLDIGDPELVTQRAIGAALGPVQGCDRRFDLGVCCGDALVRCGARRMVGDLGFGIFVPGIRSPRGSAPPM